LELNGRNFVQLALLVPGAAPANWLNTTEVGVGGGNTGISFNGGRYLYNNWEVDGWNNADEGSSNRLNTYPSLDTIAAFPISTSTEGAEMEKHAGPPSKWRLSRAPGISTARRSITSAMTTLMPTTGL